LRGRSVEEGEARLLIELRELDQQIRIAKEAKLLEQQQANRELIRNLAHEIKNPWAASAARRSFSSASFRTPT